MPRPRAKREPFVSEFWSERIECTKCGTGCILKGYFFKGKPTPEMKAKFLCPDCDPPK